MTRSTGSALSGRSRQLRRASRSTTCQADRAQHTPGDLVLNLQDARSLGVETFGPQLAAVLGLDQLDVDADPVPFDDDAALEQITDLELAPNLPRVRAPPLVGDRSVAGHNGDSGQRARKIAGETVGDPVGHVVLLRIAAEIGEWKNGDRRGRRFEPVHRQFDACQHNAVVRVRHDRWERRGSLATTRPRPAMERRRSLRRPTAGFVQSAAAQAAPSRPLRARRRPRGHPQY